jgi:cytochrome c-type biogenesis protein CcmH/NrfG
VSESAVQGRLMRQGLDALYKQNDPAAAAALFRKVLERNPQHYGANFQLAKALDREGNRAEARTLWEQVLKMAEGYNDEANLAIIRARLAQNP